jgi:hypothetical protein
MLLSPSVFAQGFDSSAEQAIFRLLNQERHSRGLSTLVSDERLQRAARKHSALMASLGEVDHQVDGELKLSLRLDEQLIRFDASGENVARTSTPERAHVALMNSPGHRANILDPDFNSVGIGVVNTPDGIYVTQDFAHRLPDASVDDAEQRVSSTINRLRQRLGLAAWPRIPAPELRRRACDMAVRDKLNPSLGLLSPKVSNSVAFTAIDLNQVPSSLDRIKVAPASGFSVGACYHASASYDMPVFWVVVITYF